jgi:phosphate transport system substrate-binding protein
MRVRNVFVVLAMFSTTLLFQNPVGASTSTAPTLSGMGSSLVGIAMGQWAADVPKKGINIDWQTSTSANGLADFANGQTDFGGSDYTYKAAGIPTPSGPYQYVPVLAYGEALTYNLVGTNGEAITDLVLDPQVIGLIFTGAITMWNASQIEDLNPELSSELPDQMIRAAFQTDPSGDSYLLTDYLKTEDTSQFDSYLDAIGVSGHDTPSVDWPTPGPDGNPTGFPGWRDGEMIGEPGPDEAAAYVAQNEGSIAYVPAGYEAAFGEPAASVVNAVGDAVALSAANVTTALGKVMLRSDLSANLEGVFNDTNPNAYPLSTYSYMVVACSPALARKENPATQCSGNNTGTSAYPARSGKELGKFIKFIACKGQQQAGELGFAYLSKDLVKDAFAAIGRLNGASEPAPPTQANCPNPAIGN